MKIAIPVWQGRVSPVLDFAEQAVLVDLDAADGRGRRFERLGPDEPHHRARRFEQLGVDVVICGAISRSLAGLITARDIRLIPLISGRVEEVISAFHEGTLGSGAFAMPGADRSRQPMP